MARTIVLNSQGSSKSTDMVTEPSPGTAEPSAITRASPSVPSKAPVATTQQPPKASSDINKEKRLSLQKPSVEQLRRPSRRIIRPQLVKPEEPPQGGDVEMPEAEGAGDEGKQPSSHVAESKGTSIVPPAQTHVRKRQADLLASEPQQETQPGTSSETAPPASKKFKGSESQPDAAEGENLSKEPAVDESMDATTAADGDNEETEAETVEEEAEESVEAQQENEAEVQDKADEPVEENPTETETIPTEEDDQTETIPTEDLLTDVEFDKEEGELELDTLDDLDEATDGVTTIRSPEIGEVQPETVATPTQSPSRMETTMEEAETTIEPPPEDVKNDEGGDVAAEEASEKPNNGNDQQQQAAETEIKPETTVATSSSTPASAASPSETPETEETKRAASPSGTVVVLADKAKENAAKRIARGASLAGVARAPLQPTRGRGRVVNIRGSGGRLVPRGGRAPRGGRGNSPSQP